MKNLKHVLIAGKNTTPLKKIKSNAHMLYVIIKKILYISKFNQVQIAKRLEFFLKKLTLNANFLHSNRLIFLLNFFFQKNTIIDKKKIYTLFFLDLLYTYNGWRHTIGLPVRGQRTWSNAKTSYNANLGLRLFRSTLFPLDSINKQVYLGQSIYSLIEQVNLLWKFNWTNEWIQIKKKQIIYLNSGKNKTIRVDLISMKNFNIYGYHKTKVTEKKNKNFFKKNLFASGFSLNFTKTLTITNDLIFSI